MSLSISKKILAWYTNNKRTLPWRNHKNQKDRHYKVLLSEFMLQQTQVKTVIPYFNNFYKEINSIEGLAKSSQKKINKLWQGLGYYRRAEHLLKCSKIISKQHNGKLPNNYEDLIKLPGVGDYTAKAILSIGFDKSEIGIDGNVQRVVSRIFAEDRITDIKKNVQKLKVKNGSSELMQGLMELGALICKPSRPHCNDCCLNKNCKFFIKNIPIKKKEPPNKKKIRKFLAIISIKKNKILITKNKNIGVLNNFNCVPLFEYKEDDQVNIQLKSIFGKKINLTFKEKIKIGISNFNAHIKIFEIDNLGKLNKDYNMFSRNDLNKELVSSLFLKILKKTKFKI